MRIAVQFGGLADLMDKFPARIAAARKIPYTRFMGNPPKGMNATGESDQDNYILMMEANREAKMRDVLGMQLDPILARHAGLKEAPEYEWRSLLELSDRDVAEAAKLKAEALQIAVTGYWMDEDEAREAINGDPVFGELPGAAPEAPEEPDPIELIEATAKAKAANAPPSTNGNGRRSDSVGGYSSIPRSTNTSGSLSFLLRLQKAHRICRLSSSCNPPFASGMIWSRW